MTAHATVVAEKKQAQQMEEHKRMAADGQLTGLFKTSQKVQAREEADVSSQPVTHIAAGETMQVLECCQLPDGDVRLRCEEGWVSMFSTKGVPRIAKVDAAEASAVAVDGMSGIAELNSQLAKEIGGDAVEERVYTVTMNKATCELRVGGMNLTVMKGPDFVASYQYT